MEEKKGNVVKAKFTIKDYGHNIPAGARGRILHTKDNGLGRTLVYVAWENADTAPVFREDIEFDTQCE